MSRLAPSMAAQSYIIVVLMYAYWMWGSWAKGTIKHSPFTIYHRGWQKGAPWIAATALIDADAAAVPEGWSFCVEAALSLSRSSSPTHPPLPSCSSSSAQLPHSGSLRPASLQLAAATVAACLLHLLYILPIFCLFPLPCSPRCSPLDYEIFSTFAVV